MKRHFQGAGVFCESHVGVSRFGIVLRRGRDWRAGETNGVKEKRAGQFRVAGNWDGIPFAEPTQASVRHAAGSCKEYIAIMREVFSGNASCAKRSAVLLSLVPDGSE